MSSFDRFKGLNFSPLDSHKQSGKKIKGVFADLPNMRDRSWLNQALPEMIWVALIRNGMDLNTFTDAFKPVARQFADLEITNATLSGISSLPADKKKVILSSLTSSSYLRKTLRPLLLFGDKLPDYALWKVAINMEPDFEEDAAILADTIARTMDHQSQESTDCRWFRLMPLLLARTFQVPEEMREEILAYPDVADMRHTRPAIRSMELMCDLITGQPEEPSQWCKDFWEICFSSTDCLIPERPESTDTYSKAEYDDFIDLQRKKLAGLKMYHEEHLPNIKLDVLIGAGLFALKVLEELSSSPASSGILGRSAIRTLAELGINAVYLCEKDDEDTWENFYFHGQGEAKKVFLKYMRAESRPAFVELSDIWLIANEARYMDFLDINLGDWDDANLRNRAIEADMKDHYDHYYDWTSNYTHATWAAIRREVYTPCQNPLHKYHLLPAHETPNDYGSVMVEAMRLVGLILALIYEQYPDLEQHKLLLAKNPER